MEVLALIHFCENLIPVFDKDGLYVRLIMEAHRMVLLLFVSDYKLVMYFDCIALTFVRCEITKNAWEEGGAGRIRYLKL